MQKGCYKTSLLRKCENPECRCDHGHGVGIAVVLKKKLNNCFITCCKICAYSPYIKALREERKKETLQKKYGVSNIIQIKEIKAKQQISSRKTLMDRYGVDSPLKVKEFADKAKEAARKTWKEKYGKDIISPYHIPGAKEKAHKTIFERYGDHPMRVKELKDINLTNMLNTKLKKYGNVFPGITSHSKISLNFFNELVKRANIQNAFYGTKEVVERFAEYEKTYKFDFFHNNKIIEFYGDYWHCNPSIYNKDFINRSGIAKEILERDKKREQIIMTKYKLLIVWEAEVNKQFDQTIEKCINFLLCD